ncbi:hypothetical protein TUBRATIS_005260 [Tubulinosema ratisbonensis]|uniref:S1 motif domain-containing protein n=1 Tax=Tubulinosema ratisbonensis TaxID=291195 RepID=A0A437APK9_9MICR|nr:hypothetical protein TUBRATIS_005260 [Tubulinosema ratisbonensis]
MNDSEFLEKCMKKYFEPSPVIGNICTAKILRVTPTSAFLTITLIDSIKPFIEYSAYIRPSDVEVNINEEKFVWDKLKENEEIQVKIISYGDGQSMYVVPTEL